MSEVIVIFLSIVQILGLVAICEMLWHNRSKRYRGWINVVAGFAPLFKMPFVDSYMFLEWLACIAGFGLLALGMSQLFAANKKELYLITQQVSEEHHGRYTK